jgi:long-chain acyl-CoA synthetase
VTATIEPAAGTASLPALLLQHARERPDDVAMREKHRGLWRELTWRGYAERVARTAHGLRELGVEPGDRVAVHSENRPEWLIADLAIQAIGAISVGIYPTSPASEVEYLLGHSESVVLIAEDEEQLDKALEVRERLPALRRIAVVDPRGVRTLDSDEQLLTFADLEELGEGATADDLREPVERLPGDGTAIIVYTSGTTGPPKGAMISHANLAWAAERFRETFDARPDDEVLSYLPLCHVAERLGSAVNALATGYVVNFGEGGDSFAQDLRDVQPTIFLGVPRVWEKMLASVQIRMGDASRAKRASYRFWTKQGERLARKRMAGGLGPADRLLARLGSVMVHRALREKLGLSRVRTAISGAAPIAPQVLEYFWALGVEVREGYGQTENTAVCTFTPPDDVRIGMVGKPLEGVELRIGEDGEILTRSEGVFQGYFKDADATASTVDPEGWLHTGDVGEIDADGFLRITDRKKDIIITAGGKNISPSEIENRLKVSPYVREAIVIGDRRKYLTALIGIELDTVGDWANRRNVAFTTYGDLARKPEVRELIDGWVQEVNREFAQVETIKRFALLEKELDHEDGELTATMKVKRRAIEQEFAAQIEELYGAS